MQHSGLRQVVADRPVAVALDFQKPLSDESMNARIDHPDRDAEFARQLSLRHGRVRFDRLEHAEVAQRFGLPEEGRAVGHRRVRLLFRH